VCEHGSPTSFFPATDAVHDPEGAGSLDHLAGVLVREHGRAAVDLLVDRHHPREPRLRATDGVSKVRCIDLTKLGQLAVNKGKLVLENADHEWCQEVTPLAAPHRRFDLSPLFHPVKDCPGVRLGFSEPTGDALCGFRERPQKERGCGVRLREDLAQDLELDTAFGGRETMGERIQLFGQSFVDVCHPPSVGGTLYRIPETALAGDAVCRPLRGLIM